MGSYVVTRLDALFSGGASQPTCITSDGTTIFGKCLDPTPNLYRAVNWVGTAVTQMFDIDPSNNTIPYYCDPSGGVIVGTASNAGATWTSGGTAGSLLTPATGYSAVGSYPPPGPQGPPSVDRKSVV